MASRLLWLALAGAAGTLARFGLQGLVQHGRPDPGAFPWGTLAVNALGCLAFGVIWVASEERQLVPPQVRLIALVGFLGAFTTWSSYVYETSQMMRNAEWGLAAASVMAQHALGFAGFFAGLALGRLL